LSQQENAADTPRTEAFDAIGVFVVDIGGGHHRFGRDALCRTDGDLQHKVPRPESLGANAAGHSRRIDPITAAIQT
jgi:hypothetical protein